MASATAMPGEHRPNDLVRDVVRSVVAGLAPEELPLVDGLRRFDDATAVRRLNGAAARRGPLGFGIGEIAMLVTPVVWLVLNEVGQRLVSRTVDRAEQGMASAFRRIFRRSQPPVEVPPLTREQMAEVRALVLASAERRGLSRRRAEEIANAVVAELALADTAETAETREALQATDATEAAGAPEPPGAAPTASAPDTPGTASAPDSPATTTDPTAPGTGAATGTGTGTGQG
ncbi:hypothetical protein AB0L35_33175 [Streptomyces sp. NPDC052309]|uniref:hypothetical protein n=1 Tax=Streptomyces sp. NPDC052309 TaxID=3155421 RepID=UPI003415351C